MSQASIGQPELPNLVTILAHKLPNASIGQELIRWENVIFSLLAVFIISLIAFLSSRKKQLLPKRLSIAIEAFVAVLDDFVCGIIGPKGRKYTPFIGTLFIYIIFMNLMGLIPFLKAPTASWSTTLALAICVFIYVQYSAIRELGFRGYLDHMMGRPRGILAFSIFIPVIMFVLHIASELLKPISLSLRLRSNIWGDDLLLAVLSGFGITGVPLIVFSSLIIIVASLVQAVVFSLLTTIYFSLVLAHEE